MLQYLIEYNPDNFRRAIAARNYSNIRAGINSPPLYTNPRYHAQIQINRLCALGFVEEFSPTGNSWDRHYHVTEYGYWTYMAYLYETDVHL